MKCGIITITNYSEYTDNFDIYSNVDSPTPWGVKIELAVSPQVLVTCPVSGGGGNES